MKRALWIWTALCAVVVVVAFFATPGWDTSAEGLFEFSGADVFVGITFLMCVLVWPVGLGILGIILGIGDLVGAMRRRRAR